MEMKRSKVKLFRKKITSKHSFRNLPYFNMIIQGVIIRLRSLRSSCRNFILQCPPNSPSDNHIKNVCDILKLVVSFATHIVHQTDSTVAVHKGWDEHGNYSAVCGIVSNPLLGDIPSSKIV